MSGLDLDTEYVLFEIRITPDSLEPFGGNFYLCPECEEGHVTHYGGGMWSSGIAAISTDSHIIPIRN